MRRYVIHYLEALSGEINQAMVRFRVRLGLGLARLCLPRASLVKLDCICTLQAAIPLLFRI